MKAGSDADAQDLKLPYGVEATQPQPAAINLCRAFGAAWAKNEGCSGSAREKGSLRVQCEGS